VFKLAEPLLFPPLFLFVWIKQVKNMYWGDLSRTTHTFEISHQYVAQPSDEPSCKKDRTERFREDWLNLWLSQTTSDPLSSFFLFKRWFVQHYPQLPTILSLNKHKSWSLKLNTICPCYLLLMNSAPMHHTSFKFFWKVTWSKHL
jgi:hypothetical protein